MAETLAQMLSDLTRFPDVAGSSGASTGAEEGSEWVDEHDAEPSMQLDDDGKYMDEIWNALGDG